MIEYFRLFFGMIRHGIPGYFRHLMYQSREAAYFWHTHYFPGSIGYEYGNIAKASSDLFEGLADALEGKHKES